MSQVKFKLVAVDLSKRTAKLWVKSEGYAKAYQVETSISRLLAARIKNCRSDSSLMRLEGVIFSSDNNDPMFIHNPLQLESFYDKDGLLKNYHVRMVTEKGYLFNKIFDRFGRVSSQKVYQQWRPSEFHRLRLIQLK